MSEWLRNLGMPKKSPKQHCNHCCRAVAEEREAIAKKILDVWDLGTQEHTDQLLRQIVADIRARGNGK